MVFVGDLDGNRGGAAQEGWLSVAHTGEEKGFIEWVWPGQQQKVKGDQGRVIGELVPDRGCVD